MMNLQGQTKGQAGHQAALNRLKKELDQAMAREASIPMEPGGWWHQYVCPTHHTELLFDELREDDGRYHCPYGCVLEREPYHGAWLVYRHQLWARRSLKAAAVYAATKELAYGSYGRDIISAYAKQFPLYPVHPDAQPWMLKGRAFHQALTEAIWATTLLQAYLLLQDAGLAFGEAQADITTFIGMLESSMEQYHHILTIERNQPENNYTAWLNAALSCVYAVKQDHAKLDSLLERKGGIRNHLEIAILNDGLEFEGSVYYHVFVLRAYLITVEMLKRFDIDGFEIKAEGSRHIEGMLDVLIRLAEEDGRLPATHDGPYGRMPYTLEIIEVFEKGLAKYQKPEYWKLLNYYYETMGQGNSEALQSSEPWAYRNAGLEALLYRQWTGEEISLENPPAASSALLPDSGFAWLRHAGNPLTAMVDFGPHGGSHGHFDKLNVMLSLNGKPISPDRGTVPYGSVLKKSWYPATACHNTVSVNGQSQQEAEGRCLSFVEEKAYTAMTMSVDGTYPGATLVRHLLVSADYIVDWYQIGLAEPGEIDWWFHFIGEPSVEGWDFTATPAALGQDNGYEYVRSLAQWSKTTSAVANADVMARVKISGLEGGNSLSSAVALSENAAAYLVESPGLADDPSVMMKGVLVRTAGASADVAAVYAAGDKELDVRLQPLDESGASGEKKLTVRIGNEQISYQLTADGIREMSL
ncbi:heparinase II/III family protein [Paenibacillus soyae]|uniref:Heparinase II/III-family protein n=1 Tax=Paenibacillus soyae TaxID=2969249 RepID=A0A9X2S6X2_9BACL|nr:heparinase II/III-family protein [Paenibacillus soyae]MCR2802699.1 heparinase II/III-family protein [Paenibacillus soyae]